MSDGEFLFVREFLNALPKVRVTSLSLLKAQSVSPLQLSFCSECPLEQRDVVGAEQENECCRNAPKTGRKVNDSCLTPHTCAETEDVGDH